MTFRLRGYTVERLLGSGSSGDVWQARAGSAGVPVALKRIVIASDEQLRRAHDEAALLAALEHPNIVRLHALLPSDDTVVLVLDLADGGSLAGLLDARGRLTPGEVITAVAPVAAALAYLHDEGVVHGDVSAANVLFTAAGVPLLCDVGVSRLTGSQADAAATPAYVDPAVAAGCVPGPPSDVFMLAGVALHALTGSPTWPAGSADEALAVAARGVLDDVAQRLSAAGAPDAMTAVLSRSLAVDPQRRGTAADLALDLRHSGQPVAVELAAGLARTEPQPVRREPGPVAGGSPLVAAGPHPVARGPRHAARPGEPSGPASIEHRGEPPSWLARDNAAAGPARPGSSTRDDAPTDPARPAFERPSTLPAGAEPPTRMVGPRPRPVVPRRPRRRLRRRLVGWVAAAVLLAGAAGAGAWWLIAPNQGANATDRSSPPPQVDPTHTVNDWPAALDALDATRARAFATRDTGLLRRVYLPGPLLTADTALLTRIVPTGCGLAGVRTRYTAVHATENGSRAVLTATATLPASRLVCGGRQGGTAPGAGPTALRLELVRTADGPRIAAQRPA
ncbi:MAG TPA: protein kinase [Jatrophihabitans sp.]|nr:protein kinase [Jatrophihabitans sp.]